MRKLLVVGGGPSGMMAAGRAAELGCDVTLLEKTARLGNKLRLTGKGRCNITNTGELDEFICNYGRNGKFLYSCFSRFFNTDLVSFFEQRGVRTVVERGNRVFPASSRADEVVNCLTGYLRENGARVRKNLSVTRILTEGGEATGVEGEDGVIEGHAVVVATGGMSYPRTGSTGDGYRLAASVGHRIVDTRPALVPLEVEEPFAAEMQGLSLENVELSAFLNGKPFVRAFGEMLFTHFGVSGPIVLTMSKDVISRVGDGKIILSINFKPALSGEKLDGRLLREFSQYGKVKFKNILAHLLPRKAVPVFQRLSGIPADKRGCEISKEERGRLLDLLQDLKLTVKRPRPIEEAIVTSGGVVLDEINSKTMESRKVRGLFFCGEVIDIDGNTGGYNLQAAFSTGYVAGESACRFLRALPGTL